MIEAALADLHALADPEKAAGMAEYHKLPRTCLGVPVPQVDACVKRWVGAMQAGERLPLADALWDSDIHEARIAAARLLAPRRLGDDEEGAWRLICRWAEGFDGWALADHACMAGHARLLPHPERMEVVARWTQHPNMWTRRAALVITLPWARLAAADTAQQTVRERVLGWAGRFLDEDERFQHKAVAWWLRELSRRDPARVQEFLFRNGGRMKPFARREAARLMA